MKKVPASFSFYRYNKISGLQTVGGRTGKMEHKILQLDCETIEGLWRCIELGGYRKRHLGG